MTKYRIGNNLFETQKQAIEYVRNMISQIEIEDIIDERHSHFNSIMEIVENHRDFMIKRGVGIHHFKIVINPLNKCKELHLYRIDDSECVVSYIVCAQDSIINKSKMKIHDIKFKLYDAMREAISEQILKFKINCRSSPFLYSCVKCGVNDQDIEYHVDHDNPSFMHLRDSFLNNKEFPTQFSYIQNTYVNKFRREDEQFKNEWAEYHRQNASLQILCKDCNLRKPKKEVMDIPIDDCPF
jgi:hypothetical protein